MTAAHGAETGRPATPPPAASLGTLAGLTALMPPAMRADLERLADQLAAPPAPAPVPLELAARLEQLEQLADATLTAVAGMASVLAAIAGDLGAIAGIVPAGMLARTGTRLVVGRQLAADAELIAEAARAAAAVRVAVAAGP